MIGRLRFGPHAGRHTAQVVLCDPQYCLWWMAERPDSPLAETFRCLVAEFDAHALVKSCSCCGRRAHQAHAVSGAVDLVASCRTCSIGLEPTAATHFIRSFEDALRHVAQTCPRAHRILMRRIVKELAMLKGGPQRVTEDAARAWFSGPALRLCARPAAAHRAVVL